MASAPADSAGAGAGARVRAAARSSATAPAPASTTIPTAQPDLKLRELNSQPSTPGLREEVFCTKVGTTRPDEMYIVGGHMDGIGFGEAANDDGSGTGSRDGAGADLQQP